MSEIRKKIFPSDAWAYISFFIVAVLSLVYSFTTGVNLVLPDSLFYSPYGTDLAGSSEPIYPVYAAILGLVFSGENMESAHVLLVLCQTAFLATGFFPLRALLDGKAGLKSWEANALAVAIVLSPVFLTHTALVTPNAVFTGLLFWFAWLLETSFTASEDRPVAIMAGILGGIILLTNPSGWIVWTACFLTLLISYAGKKSSIKAHSAALLITLIPLLMFLAWLLAGQVSGPLWPEVHGNNPLARFNFLKNGFVFLIYAALPFAGVALLLAALFKRNFFWADPLARFAFFLLAGGLFFGAFTIDVVVDRKLDYFSNRLLEPFLFLPAIIFFRLPEAERKEIVLNSLLIFFVLAIFGLPFVLKLDFRTGLSFWAQSLSNANLGIIKNLIFFLFLCIPAAFAVFKPQRFVAAYAVVALLLAGVGAFATHVWWKMNEDSQMALMDARHFATDPELASATYMATDFSCRMEDNTDVAYLYRCLDVMKGLYFVPRNIERTSREKLLRTDIGKDATIAILDSESDMQIGKTVAAAGLAKITLASAADLGRAVKAPDISITKIAGMRRYIYLRYDGKMRRVTALEPKNAVEIESSKKGCAIMEIRLAMDDKKLPPLSFLLNGKPVKSVKLLPMSYEKLPEVTRLQIALPAGKSYMQLGYDTASDLPDHLQAPNLIMFGRPSFTTCN
jgi:hypothetical protein